MMIELVRSHSTRRPIVPAYQYCRLQTYNVLV